MLNDTDWVNLDLVEDTWIATRADGLVVKARVGLPWEGEYVAWVDREDSTRCQADTLSEAILLAAE